MDVEQHQCRAEEEGSSSSYPTPAGKLSKLMIEIYRGGETLHCAALVSAIAVGCRHAGVMKRAAFELLSALIATFRRTRQ